MILQFKKLKRVLKRFQKVEPQMFDNIGYLVFREAQETCPVDTGRLKASGTYNIDTTKPMKANGWLEKAYQKIKGELPFQIQGEFPDSIVRSTRNGY